MKKLSVVSALLLALNVSAGEIMPVLNIGSVNSASSGENLDSSSFYGLDILYRAGFSDFKFEIGPGLRAHKYRTQYDSGFYKAGEFEKTSFHLIGNSYYSVNNRLDVGLNSQIGKIDLGLSNSQFFLIGPSIHLKLVDDFFGLRVSYLAGADTKKETRMISVGFTLSFDPSKEKNDEKKEIFVSKEREFNSERYQFGTYKYLPSSSNIELIKNVAKFIKSKNYTHILVVGHTDSTGNDDINIPLSKMRARSVSDVLVDEGVDKERVTVLGSGSSSPIENNSTKEGRAKNRRVEIIVTFKEEVLSN